MRKILAAVLLLTAMLFLATGCGKVKGPRFWWDDRNQTRLAGQYYLPDDPGAPSEEGIEYPAETSGTDVSEDNLRDYRMNLDQEEEKRKSESSLLDF